MITLKRLKRLCEKQISAMSITEKGKTCQNEKLKGLIILNIKRRVSHLIKILGIIMHVMFLIKVFKEIKVTPNKTLLAPEINNFQIITVITLKITNVKKR